MSNKIIENSSVLVTGGAGFIGSNLCERLIEQDNKVVCLDNFSTGKKENISKLLSNGNFNLIEGDIRDIEVCKRATLNIDYVLHQAALGSVPRSIDDPITTNEVNISGFLNMLVAVKDSGIKRFVYACSSSTYGDHKSLPKIEENIGNPLSPYAVTKYVNELYAKVFSDLYGIETIGLRYFNVFGPRQSPDGQYAAAIPKFANALINHSSPNIHGDGLQSRDFTFIENVIQMNQIAVLSKQKEALGQIFNVAYGNSTSVNELFNILRELLGKYDNSILNIQPTYGPTRQGDVKHSLASIDKAKTILGYVPKYDIRIGLEKSIEWYWQELSNVTA